MDVVAAVKAKSEPDLYLSDLCSEPFSRRLGDCEAKAERSRCAIFAKADAAMRDPGLRLFRRCLSNPNHVRHPLLTSFSLIGAAIVPGASFSWPCGAALCENNKTLTPTVSGFSLRHLQRYAIRKASEDSDCHRCVFVLPLLFVLLSMNVDDVRVLRTDRGGTFTDCLGKVPGRKEGDIVVKLLSHDPANYEDAPREGIRRILEIALDKKIPRSEKIETGSIGAY